MLSRASERASESLREMEKEMLELYSQRQL